MVGRVLIATALGVALTAAPAQAQHFELSFMGGYTTSEGISGDGIIAPIDGNVYNSIDVKSGGSFAFSFGYVASSGGEFGFQWSRQMSKLGVSGPANSVDFGDMSVDNYHGYFAYNFMPDAKVRPYVMIGFGATDYGSVDYTAPLRSGTISGPTRFSTTWGAGVKAWLGEKFAVRGGFRWTPTYITSSSEGWWCDPWWGCYVVGDSKYAHQFEMSGGVTFRFGGS